MIGSHKWQSQRIQQISSGQTWGLQDQEAHGPVPIREKARVGTGETLSFSMSWPIVIGLYWYTVREVLPPQ